MCSPGHLEEGVLPLELLFPVEPLPLEGVVLELLVPVEPVPLEGVLLELLVLVELELLEPLLLLFPEPVLPLPGVFPVEGEVLGEITLFVREMLPELEGLPDLSEVEEELVPPLVSVLELLELGVPELLVP
jgi:hypothetical protein